MRTPETSKYKCECNLPEGKEVFMCLRREWSQNLSVGTSGRGEAEPNDVVVHADGKSYMTRGRVSLFTRGEAHRTNALRVSAACLGAQQDARSCCFGVDLRRRVMWMTGGPVTDALMRGSVEQSGSDTNR